MSKQKLGVSIVICCHNSASRLPQTLTHLQAQQVTKGAIPWEVIVVDNVSTDQTASVALNLWPEDAPAPLRVVSEPQLGLIHARIRGFQEARFELVSFIDDDNQVCPHWVERVSELMSQHPEVGACGGSVTAVSESTLPPWFERYKESYAVGEQTAESNDITSTRGYLWGAGLTIRKSAWQQLLDAGFCPSLSGRKGTTLSSGEDNEICFALRLAGWRLWYEKQLKLQHYLSAHRLEWQYLRRLRRGCGTSSVLLEAYYLSLQASDDMVTRFKQIWLIRIISSFRHLLIQLCKLLLSYSNPLEREQAVLEYEFWLGNLLARFRHWRDYGKIVERVRSLAEALKTVSQ